MIRSTEDLLSCATLYPLDAASDEANTRRDILIAKMKEVIRERGELDCELLLTATMSTREKRIQLTKKIKHLKAALLSSGKRGRPRTLSDAEKKQHRQIWNQTYYRRLQSRARAFLQYEAADSSHTLHANEPTPSEVRSTPPHTLEPQEPRHKVADHVTSSHTTSNSVHPCNLRRRSLRLRGNQQ